MSGRLQVTGYFTPDENEVDPDSPTGLTEEAYLDLIGNENGTGLRVSDLDDVEVEHE